jgi:uncharacterized protein involved in exopolysaccharide biosynthesis
MEQNSIPRNQDPVAANGQPTRDIVIEDAFPPKAHPFDYVAIVSRYRWLLVTLIVGATALLVAYLMVMPQTFAATATLLPPNKSEGISFGALLKNNAGIDLAGLSENSSAEVFTTILRSRTLADSLVRRFDLVRLFGLPPGQRQRAADALLGQFEISSDRHGIMQITYQAKTGFSPSPEEQDSAARFSARIVNAAIEILDYLNREKSVTNARQTKEYLGRMTRVKRAERDSIQSALLRFQQTNRAVALDKQIEASVMALSESQAQISKKELELTAAESEAGPDNRLAEMLRTQLAELRRQKAKIESGGEGSSSLGLNLRNLPDVARQYANLKLDLEVATQVYTFLETQYNQQQVQEAKDLPTVNVLDSAQVPEYRSAPRRGVALAISLPAIIGGALFLIFMIEYFRRIVRSSKARRIEEFQLSAGARRLEGKRTV